MQEQEIWQVKTPRRGDSWGDVCVLEVCGVMGCKRSGKYRTRRMRKGNG